MNNQDSNCKFDTPITGTDSGFPSGRKSKSWSRSKVIALSVALFLLVFSVFLPAVTFGFLDYYDDNDYVVENSQVQKGLTIENISWAFGDVNVGFYHPLTLLSHMLDCQLYGLKPWGHHLTSILIHAINALLVFLLFRRMTGAIWRSLFVAALFGIHPLRVESVVWIGERKDVLSTFFWLLTTLFYVRYSHSKNPRSKACYTLSLLFFAMGLLSKPMLVTLPFALLLLDYWPLKRFERLRSKDFGLVLLEKVPFLLISLAASVIAVVAEKEWGALSMELPLAGRLSNALISYCRYLDKLMVPIKLAVYYPYRANWPAWQVVLAGTLLLAISALAVALMRRHPYFAVGWFWFIGTLVPVIGIMQIVSHAMADRYSYVPSIGFFMAVTWGAHELTAGKRRQQTALRVAGGTFLLACVFLMSRQLGHWKNTESLLRHTLAVTENNVAIHNCLGHVLAKRPERLPEAISEYEQALRIDPNNSSTLNNLGTALMAFPERLPEAIAHYRAALRLNPNDVYVHMNLGEALGKTPGRLAEAIAEYESALRLRPQFAMVHVHLGEALERVPNRSPEAIAEYEKALSPHADQMTKHAAHYNLGIVLARNGRLPEAISHFQAALHVRPDDPDASVNLGIALLKNAQVSEAKSQLEQALTLNPDSAVAHFNLAVIFEKIPGHLEEAVAHYEMALRINPDSNAARQALERLRASLESK